jgi:ABC-type transport system substrate-binding protein
MSLPQLNDKVGVGWNGLAIAAVITGPTTDPGQALVNGPLSGNTTWKANNEPEPALALAKQAASELNPDKRNEMYRQLSKMLVDDYAQWTYLYYGTGITAISNRIKGDTFGQSTLNPWMFAWIEK